jgi:hypothetical protein
MFTSIMLEGIACIVAVHVIVLFVSLSLIHKQRASYSLYHPLRFLLESRSSKEVTVTSFVDPLIHPAQPHSVQSNFRDNNFSESTSAGEDSRSVVVVSAHSLLHGKEGHFIGTYFPAR